MQYIPIHTSLHLPAFYQSGGVITVLCLYAVFVYYFVCVCMCNLYFLCSLGCFPL